MDLGVNIGILLFSTVTAFATTVHLFYFRHFEHKFEIFYTPNLDNKHIFNCHLISKNRVIILQVERNYGLFEIRGTKIKKMHLKGLDVNNLNYKDITKSDAFYFYEKSKKTVQKTYPEPSSKEIKKSKKIIRKYLLKEYNYIFIDLKLNRLLLLSSKLFFFLRTKKHKNTVLQLYKNCYKAYYSDDKYTIKDLNVGSTINWVYYLESLNNKFSKLLSKSEILEIGNELDRNITEFNVNYMNITLTLFNKEDLFDLKRIIEEFKFSFSNDWIKELDDYGYLIFIDNKHNVEFKNKILSNKSLADRWDTLKRNIRYISFNLVQIDNELLTLNTLDNSKNTKSVNHTLENYNYKEDYYIIENSVFFVSELNELLYSIKGIEYKRIKFNNIIIENLDINRISKNLMEEQNNENKTK